MKKPKAGKKAKTGKAGKMGVPVECDVSKTRFIGYVVLRQDTREFLAAVDTAYADAGLVRFAWVEHPETALTSRDIDKIADLAEMVAEAYPGQEISILEIRDSEKQFITVSVTSVTFTGDTGGLPAPDIIH